MLQPEEVVEVFVGDTLEEAMAFAVAALGPDLSVRRARKVRRGVQGLVGRDRYEVVAVPPPSPDRDALESAFEALLSQAEEAELPRARRVTTRPHPSPEVADHEPRYAEPIPVRTTRRPAVYEEPAPARAVAVRPPAPRSPAARRQPASTQTPRPRPAPTPAPSVPMSALPAPRKKASAKPAARTPRVKASSGWSRQSLVALGLPPAVLAGLPAAEPGDDLGWVVALAVAMSAVLPAPAALDAEHPLVVNGHGLAGVLGLLDAAGRGLTPGTITVGDRTAAATATELALTVRTAVMG